MAALQWSLLVSLVAGMSSAQTVLEQQVLSTFIYTMYGDRTPMVLPQTPSLTPLGAQQLYQAGSNFRARYVTPVSDTANDEFSAIRNISPYQLFADEISVYSTNDQWIEAGAQAFMQGLYPPLATSSNYTYISGQSPLANGSNVVAPLNGYQYPNIQSSSSNDLNSIYLAGSRNCPVFTEATSAYYQNPSFQAIMNSTTEFYNNLKPEFLDGIFKDSAVGFFDAWYIYDYLNYEFIHNSTVADQLDEEQLTSAKILAADWVFAMNANTTVYGVTPGDHVGVIAGRTLAARIMQAFYTTINTQGASEKMTLLFGSYEPMIAFAALTQLISPMNAAFYNIPEPGSSFVLELFAMRDNDIGTYPAADELFVRFLYQNGTADDSALVEYPMFGLGPSQTVISFSDFVTSMETLAIFNIEDWCNTCVSYSIFCPAFTDDTSNLNRGSSGGRRGLNPAVAGVIGAVVAVIVIGLALATLMLLTGCRLQRTHSKRRSELAGFKGAEKLASDQDLTIPKGGAAVAVNDTEGQTTRGHERVGSWELRDQAKAEEAQRTMPSGPPQARRPSFEDDELHISAYGNGVKPHENV